MAAVVPGDGSSHGPVRQLRAARRRRCRTVARILPNGMVELVLGGQSGSLTLPECLTTAENCPQTLTLHGERARRYGYPAPGRPEHGTHDSMETRNGCVHRVAVRPHRMPTLDPGLRPALNPTLRLPCGLHGQGTGWPGEGWRPKPGSSLLLLHQGRLNRMGPTRAVCRGATGRPSPMLTHTCSRQGVSGHGPVPPYGHCRLHRTISSPDGDFPRVLFGGSVLGSTRDSCYCEQARKRRVA